MSTTKTAESDYQTLFEMVGILKRQFWTYDRNQERFKARLVRQHNSFFSKVQPQISAQLKRQRKKRQLKKKDGDDGSGEKAPNDPEDSEEACNEAMIDDCAVDQDEMDAVNQMLKNPFVLKIIEAVKKVENPAEFISSKTVKKAIKQAEEERLKIAEQNPKTREKIKDGWFLDEMKFDFDKVHEEEKDESYFKVKAEMEAEAKQRETQIAKMLGDEVLNMNLNEYKRILHDHEMASNIMLKVKDRNPFLQKINVEALCKVIKNADKDLFVQLRDGEITFNQLKARLAERRDGVKYVVLDDLRDQLDSQFFEEYKQQKQDKRRARSTHSTLRGTLTFKKQLPRDKVPRVQNYRSGRDACSVDFYQDLTCKKTTHIEKNYNKLQLLKVPKLKEVKPEDLESKITQDPEKAKKKENILKLKKQLEHKLWDHKMLVLQQMPYDSSSVKFHDEMDILFGGQEVKKPKDWVSTKVKNKTTPGIKRTDEPVLSQCEVKMRENQKRRTQMLFFKRLELDGAQIIVSQQDKDLFRNFGKARDEELAEDDLEIAIL